MDNVNIKRGKTENKTNKKVTIQPGQQHTKNTQNY